MITIIAPKKDAVVSLLTAEQKNFIEDTHRRENTKAEAFDYLNLVTVSEDRTCPAPVSFVWESDKVNVEFVLEISLFEDFTDKTEIHTTQTKADVFNLFIGETYYFRVSSKDEASSVHSFRTGSATPRCIHIPGLVNVRDAGGWTTASGKRIRQGLLYRGCKMEITKSGKPPFILDEGKPVMVEQLKIKTDMDLRFDCVGKHEFSELEDRGVLFKLLPCMSCEDFLLEENADSNRKIFEFLAERENYPIYMHCWGGADRTGTVMFLLGAILGMSEEDMLLDYEFTSLAIWGIRSRNGESVQKFKEGLAQYGADPEDWPANAIGYLRSIGVTDKIMDKIRAIFLED